MKKLTFEHVKNYIENEGYQLLSTEYVNITTKLDMVCPEKHSFSMIYDSFRNGRRCPICYGKHKHEFSYIKDFVENTGYKLISDSYTNVGTKLDMICTNGHQVKMTFNHFKNGHRCLKCSGKEKIDYSVVKEIVESKDIILLSTEYINKKNKLTLQCKNGHVFEKSFVDVERTKGILCPVCKENNNKYRKRYFSDDFHKYELLVRKLTKRTYKKYEKYINPNEKVISILHNHLDHKYSIYQGFIDCIPPYIISSKYNLEVIKGDINLVKGHKCSITKEELFSEYFRENKLPTR